MIVDSFKIVCCRQPMFDLLSRGKEGLDRREHRELTTWQH